MSKALTYYSIVISSFLMAFIFTTATTYTQLGLAVVLFPVFSFFILKILPRKQKVILKNMPISTQPLTTTPQISPVVQPQFQPQINSDETVEDIDKRAFLKIIGATSISLFITSIFARRADSLFFSNASAGPLSLRDTNGKTVNPVERQPTDGYQITEIDDAETSYFGFTNKDGAWFIMKQDTDTGSFRYTRGDSNFSANWTDRSELDYSYFHEVFN